MTTIQEIRDALKGYESLSISEMVVESDGEAEDFRWRCPDYIHTLLAEIDRLSKEHDALRARVDELNGLRKYQASLSSKDCQASTMIWGRGADQAETYRISAHQATNKTPPAKKLLGTPIRPAILLLASSACSIAGVYSPHAVWFIIPALAFIMIALITQ